MRRSTKVCACQYETAMPQLTFSSVDPFVSFPFRTRDMMTCIDSLLDLPLQAHRSGGWASLDPRDIWGGGPCPVGRYREVTDWAFECRRRGRVSLPPRTSNILRSTLCCITKTDHSHTIYPYASHLCVGVAFFPRIVMATHTGCPADDRGRCWTDEIGAGRRRDNGSHVHCQVAGEPLGTCLFRQHVGPFLYPLLLEHRVRRSAFLQDCTAVYPRPGNGHNIMFFLLFSSVLLPSEQAILCAAFRSHASKCVHFPAAACVYVANM